MATYRGAHFAVFLLIATLMTAAVYIGLPYTLEVWIASGAGLHAFLYERSAIQWCTVFVLLFILTLLGDRILRTSRLSSNLRVYREGGEPRRDDAARAIALRIEALQRCQLIHGQEAAAAYCSELHADDEDGVGRVYGLANNGIQLMLAFGFLGTVWGVSQSVFGSFANLGDATTVELKKGLQGFTAGLGTALDTTVLGILCTLFATISSAIVNWVEVSNVGELDAMVRRHLWIDRSSALAGDDMRRVEVQLAELPNAIARATVEALRQEREGERR